jgi:hypothetical protein
MSVTVRVGDASHPPHPQKRTSRVATSRIPRADPRPASGASPRRRRGERSRKRAAGGKAPPRLNQRAREGGGGSGRASEPRGARHPRDLISEPAKAAGGAVAQASRGGQGTPETKSASPLTRRGERSRKRAAGARHPRDPISEPANAAGGAVAQASRGGQGTPETQSAGGATDLDLPLGRRVAVTRVTFPHTRPVGRSPSGHGSPPTRRVPSRRTREDRHGAERLSRGPRARREARRASRATGGPCRARR